MVNNEYIIPKQNFKKVEEVREIENLILTYEEFMKTYEQDSKVNYEDLANSDIGEIRGYGPCSISTCSYPNKCFYLKIGFSFNPIFDKPSISFQGGRSTFEWLTMNNVEEAREVLRKVRNSDYKIVTEHKGLYSKNDLQNRRKEIISKISYYINFHERGNNVYEACVDLRITEDKSNNYDDEDAGLSPCNIL